jgi:hypothetical protein
VFSFDVLLAGAKTDDAWLEAVVTMTQEAHFQFPEQLHAVWIDVLETARIELVREI